MSFVNPVFAPFLLFVLAIFLTLTTLRAQLAWLLACSYLFYAWWNPRFLILLLVSSAVDYAIGLGIPRARSAAARKGLLIVSLTVNLGLLATFKYLGFLVDAMVQGLEFFSLTWQAPENRSRPPTRDLVLHFPNLELHHRRLPPTDRAVP